MCAVNCCVQSNSCPTWRPGLWKKLANTLPCRSTTVRMCMPPSLLLYVQHVPLIKKKSLSMFKNIYTVRSKSIWSPCDFVNRIRVVEWPAPSLDLNSNRKLVGWYQKYRFRGKTNKCRATANVVMSSWVWLPAHGSQKLVISMQHNCEAVSRNHGYKTKY